MKRLFVSCLCAVAFISLISVNIQDIFAQNNSDSNGINTFGNATSVDTNQDARNIYETKSFTVDHNVRNFVVLIPNEAHESTNQDKNQYPFLNQAYIPTDLTISKGTGITWLNGDVDHDHVIKFEPSNPQNLEETNEFAFPEYTTIVFNQTGSYSYYEDNVNDDDESFVMKGTINVVDPNTENLNATNPDTTQNGEGTTGVLMVPTQDFENIKSDLENSGIRVLSDYSFTDLRGGQSGTGPTQSIVLWASNSNNIEEAIAPIIDITNGLPYS